VVHGPTPPRDWQAKWIGRDEPAPPSTTASPRACSAGVPGSQTRPAAPTVYYSGLGSSELYLNGAKVGDHGPSPPV